MVVALALAGAPDVSVSQESEPLGTIFLGNRAALMPGLWRDAGQAAGLPMSGVRRRAAAGVSGLSETGNFRRPQSPLDVLTPTFFAEGEEPVFGWQTAARFRYQRRSERDVRWTNAADAYSGNPYLWADSVGGTWSKDEVALSAAIGTPEMFERATAGIGLEYRAGQGARQNDPRPLYRLREVKVSPGLAVRLSGNHRIGVEAQFGWHREENEMGYFTADADYTLYRLRGLGSFDRTEILGTSDRATVGASSGIGAGYEGAVSAWHWVLIAEVRRGQADVRDGITLPSFAGRFFYRDFAVRGAARMNTGTGGFDVRAMLTDTDRRGAEDFNTSIDEGLGEPDFLATNTLDRLHRAGVETVWWQGDRRAPSLLLRAEVQTNGIARRDLVAETEWETRSLQLTLGAGLRRSVGGEVTVFAMADAARTVVTGSHYEAARPTALTPILVRPDFLIHASGFSRYRFVIGAETGAGFLSTNSSDGERMKDEMGGMKKEGMNDTGITGGIRGRIFIEGSVAVSDAVRDGGERFGQRTAVQLTLEIFY